MVGGRGGVWNGLKGSRGGGWWDEWKSSVVWWEWGLCWGGYVSGVVVVVEAGCMNLQCKQYCFTTSAACGLWPPSTYQQNFTVKLMLTERTVATMRNPMSTNGNSTSCLLNISWMAVEFPAKATAILRPAACRSLLQQPPDVKLVAASWVNRPPILNCRSQRRLAQHGTHASGPGDLGFCSQRNSNFKLWKTPTHTIPGRLQADNPGP